MRSTLEVASTSDALTTLEVRSRHIVERMAIALQSAILMRAAKLPDSHSVAAAFTLSRLDSAHSLAFGTLSGRTPRDPHRPRVAVAKNFRILGVRFCACANSPSDWSTLSSVPIGARSVRLLNRHSKTMLRCRSQPRGAGTSARALSTHA